MIVNSPVIKTERNNLIAITRETKFSAIILFITTLTALGLLVVMLPIMLDK